MRVQIDNTNNFSPLTFKDAEIGAAYIDKAGLIRIRTDDEYYTLINAEQNVIAIPRGPWTERPMVRFTGNVIISF